MKTLSTQSSSDNTDSVKKIVLFFRQSLQWRKFLLKYGVLLNEGLSPESNKQVRAVTVVTVAVFFRLIVFRRNPYAAFRRQSFFLE
jgi:hypothetical protein